MVRTLIRRERPITPFAPLSRFIDQVLDEPVFSQPMFAMTPVARQGGFELDLSEDDQNLIVRATLPGFTKDEVNVELDEGVLTITGEHNEEKTEGREGERFY